MSNISERITYRYPTPADLEDLTYGLSIEDRNELLAQGADPAWAIELSVRTSAECVSILDPYGRLACITGVAVNDDLGGQVYPWLLAKPLMQDYPRQVLRLSRILLNRWRSQYPYMFNYVDARHTRAIRWLEFLGAKLEPAEPHGIYFRPFHKFSFGEETCASQL